MITRFISIDGVLHQITAGDSVIEKLVWKSITVPKRGTAPLTVHQIKERL